jgi:hypothetical protein
MKLPTSSVIIFVSNTSQEIELQFKNITADYAPFYLSSIEKNIDGDAIPPDVTVSFLLTIEACELVTAYSSLPDSIEYKILSGGVDITPAQKNIPLFNSDTFAARREKNELSLTYLATQITNAQMITYIQTFRNQIADYKNGLDTLQSSIQSSALSFLNAQRKTDLLNILN